MLLAIMTALPLSPVVKLVLSCLIGMCHKFGFLQMTFLCLRAHLYCHNSASYSEAMKQSNTEQILRESFDPYPVGFLCTYQTSCVFCLLYKESRRCAAVMDPQKRKKPPDMAVSAHVRRHPLRRFIAALPVSLLYKAALSFFCKHAAQSAPSVKPIPADRSLFK